MSARAIVDAIIEEAKATWGAKEKDYIPALVARYCELESAETGKEIKPVQRRSQIVTALKKGNPTLETLLRLATCVNGEFQIVFTRQEIKQF